MTITHLSATARREQDRTGYLDHDRLAHSLKLEAAGFQAVADRAFDCLPPDADRLARTRCEILRRGYSQLAEDFEDLAAEVAAYRDDYWSRITSEQP